MAAQSYPHVSFINPLETYQTNIDGTENMLELAELNSAKLIFFSSSEIYGDPDSKNIPTKEE